VGLIRRDESLCSRASALVSAPSVVATGVRFKPPISKHPLSYFMIAVIDKIAEFKHFQL